MEPDGRFRGPGVADNGAGLAALLAVARAREVEPRHRGPPRRPDAGRERRRRGRGQPERDAPPLPAVAGGGEHRAPSWCSTAPNRPHHRPRAGQPPLRGHLQRAGRPQLERLRHRPTRCTRSAGRWRCFRIRAWTASPKSSINVGVVEGGTGINAIPAQARAKVDIRSESNAKLDELVEALNAAIAEAQELENQRATGGKVAAKIREIGSRPAAALAENAPILAVSARRWTPTSASARAWTAPPPTPTFPCRSVTRPSPSAPAARAAARTPSRSGSNRRGATSA